MQRLYASWELRLKVKMIIVADASVPRVWRLIQLTFS